ncbi:MAG: hypothetical protein OEM38_06585 [Gammaproteobacteria bacterium]|nr:hypothetical protein [Gammaproteobacteria bacterium]
MFKITQIFLALLLGMNLFSCSVIDRKNTAELQKHENTDKLKFAGDMLSFSEKIGDESETNSRMIVTEGYLRIDDGPKSVDFVLFDRANKVIYNVIAEEKSIMVIDSQDEAHLLKLKSDFPILWNVESQTSHALVKNDDQNSASATHYSLKLNQKECYNLVALDQGMDKPLAALREFRQALANQLMSQYKRQQGQECYEAVNVFTPLNHLHQGFPIREWSIYGYQRFLVDYRKMIIFPKRLFMLPEGYSQIKI